jgi:hypothetical protein
LLGLHSLGSYLLLLIENLPLIANQIPGNPKAKKNNIALNIDGSDLLLDINSPLPNCPSRYQIDNPNAVKPITLPK